MIPPAVDYANPHNFYIRNPFQRCLNGAMLARHIADRYKDSHNDPDLAAVYRAERAYRKAINFAKRQGKR
jgi:hypothetical protein